MQCASTIRVSLVYVTYDIHKKFYYFGLLCIYCRN